MKPAVYCQLQSRPVADWFLWPRLKYRIISWHRSGAVFEIQQLPPKTDTDTDRQAQAQTQTDTNRQTQTETETDRDRNIPWLPITLLWFSII